MATIGAESVSAALAEARRLAPVVGFLACVLVLAKLCDDDGLFRYLGAWLSSSTARKARGQRGGDAGGGCSSRVFVVAAVTTAVLSLDATVVLLTPVVLIAAGRLRCGPGRTPTPAGTWRTRRRLLLPVSNLTNLLAFSVSGLSFGRFAALMALPWLAAIGVEYVVISRFFAADLSTTVAAPAPVRRRLPKPVTITVAAGWRPDGGGLRPADAPVPRSSRSSWSR